MQRKLSTGQMQMIALGGTIEWAYLWDPAQRSSGPGRQC